MEKAGEYGLPHEARENEERTRLIVEWEWQKRCVSCRRRGAVPRFRLPLPHPYCLFPRRPNRGPSLQNNRRRNEESREKDGEACREKL